MKGKRALDRPQSYKVLEGEAEKLKDKLEGLRQQIKAKKQEKELSKTMHSMDYPHPKPTTATTATVNKEDQLFKLVLNEIKLDPVEGKLRERGILNLEQLYACSDQQVDEWKEIPVGYRIKLKKHIDKNRQKPTSPFQIPPPSPQLDIEQIIKHRKAEQVFVPLGRKDEGEDGEEGEGEEERELEEAQQEKMMLSILQAFSVKQRSSSMASSKKDKKEKNVHWSLTVDEMEKNHKVKVYPKESISKSVFHAVQIEKDNFASKMQEKSGLGVPKGIPDYKYCWSCLKRIDKPSTTHSHHSFCSPSCEFTYQQTVNPTRLLQEIQQTQSKYNQYRTSGYSGPSLPSHQRDSSSQEIDLIFQ